ncbi:MAG: helix-turn-helix transcriptional regulator [Eubacteriales bacterium]
MGQVKEIVRSNLKIYRKLKKMTQKDLAEALDVTHSSISAWELGKNSIDMDMLNKICKILDITPAEIYAGNNSYEVAETNEEMKKHMEYIQERPEVKRLLLATQTSRKEDVLQAIKIIEALKKR